MESQVVATLGEDEVDVPVTEVCCKDEIGNGLYDQWKSMYAGVSSINSNTSKRSRTR